MDDGSTLLNLDLIREASRITARKAGYLKESCIWCLLSCQHTNGVHLRVINGAIENTYIVFWNSEPFDTEELNRSYNEDDAVEHGAEAIALLLSSKVTCYDAVQRATRTTGIDYWLGFKSAHPDKPFQSAARLEVSGILCEKHGNTVRDRAKEKMNQTRQSGNSLPVYVIVVEFTRPYARVEGRHENC